MATGYTDKVQKGELTSFKEFAYLCTRAMGVAVLQREESLDVPLKEEYTADTSFWEKSLSKAYAGLIAAIAWTPEEAQEKADAAYAEHVQHAKEANARTAEQLKNYRAMLAKVLDWTPPTSEHQGLKNFMIEQLQDSIKHDGYLVDVPSPITGEEYRVREIQAHQRSISLSSEQIEKEITRAQSRTEWIKAFKDSVDNLN